VAKQPAPIQAAVAPVGLEMGRRDAAHVTLVAMTNTAIT
jgi:hypothetical protein